MIYDVLGWIGMILVLLAYGLLSTNKIPNGKLYQVLNLLAAIFMAIGVFREYHNMVELQRLDDESKDSPKEVGADV